MKNILLVILLIIIAGLFVVGKVGYKNFQNIEQKLQGQRDSNTSVIISLELRNKTLLDSNVSSHKRELKLLDRLKTSQESKENIKKYYEERFNYIHSASDDEYLQYLRARISDTN